MDNTIERILHRIREERIKSRLSQGQMAELLAMSTSTYSELERGVRKLSVSDLLMISKSLHVDVYYLLYGRIGVPVYDGIEDNLYTEMVNNGLLDSIIRELGNWARDINIIARTDEEKEIFRRISLTRIEKYIKDFMDEQF
jgi:transcriptional regulator with XRE-family HTH domain